MNNFKEKLFADSTDSGLSARHSAAGVLGTREPFDIFAGHRRSVWFRFATISALLLGLGVNASAQHEDKPRPQAWNNLVYGGRFMDRILPAPIYKGLETGTWGTDAVRPRDIHNGIEDADWSYWGGRPILEPDGQYHMFVARWREDNPGGHGGWPKSEIVHAVSDRPTGPFGVTQVLGPGHFPEITRLKNGKYVVYHFHGCYTSDSIEGPWENHHKRDIGFPKATFGSLAVREDGSLLMLDRVMRVWIKENGSDEFILVNKKWVQPSIPAKYGYEDPMVWRTEVQYHTIVNDWHGRTAYLLRSKDGVHWKEDPGEAYTIDFDGYEDGTKVGWYKYERPKILQDQYGRATHLYLAVIDVPKKEDLSKDNHSSKNIVLPLVVGRRLKILNSDKITAETETIRLQICAEEGFNPHTDVDVDSLQFGAPEKVDFGHGCKPVKSEKSGKDIIVTFDAKGNGITEGNFAAKLIGKTAKGKLLFGYSRLPGVDYSPYEVNPKPARNSG